MSRRRVTWGQAERYFNRHEFEIRSSGGDKIIIAPRHDSRRRSRPQVRIGHKYCSRRGDELSWGYLSVIKNAFGVTADDILNE